jgi:hypoxanthine phosphoribosyltransferase
MNAPRVRVLYDEASIARRNAEMAREIAAVVSPDLIVIAVLKGSFMFAADLIRALHRAGLAPQVEFIHLSSYRSGTVSSGNVSILRDVESSVRGRDVLLVDDVLESGRTLVFAKDLLMARGAGASSQPFSLRNPASGPSKSRPNSSASTARTSSSLATAWTLRTTIVSYLLSAWSPTATRNRTSLAELDPRMARILLVDDEEPVRGFLKRGLELDGHDVTTAVDGSDALERLTEAGGFDLMLTDIRMPIMDGIALALAAKRDFPDLPILLMTGYADQRERAKNLDVIIEDVLTKPFSLAEARGAVTRVLEARRPAA